MNAPSAATPFHAAMVKMALWRARNPGKKTEDEPADVAAAREAAMTVLASLAEGDTDPWMRREVRVIIRKSTRYIVYLDQDLEIQWWWTDRLQAEEGLSIVQANVVRLSCASAFLVPRAQGAAASPAPACAADAARAQDIRSLIAESMAMMLNKVSLAECQRVQAMAEQEILLAKDQCCRGIFFGAFAGAVLLLLLVDLLLSQLWVSAVPLGHALLAGAFGALVSAMSRTRALALEPQSGRRGLMTEAWSRALIGAGAALLVHFAYEAELVLKAALAVGSDTGAMAGYFLCMAAGASERVLPALVGRAEAAVTGATADGGKSGP